MTTPLQQDFSKAVGKSRIPDGESPTTVPFWGEDPDAWDTVIIARKKLPGLCEVKGKGFGQRMDKKKAAGKNGQSFTHLGIECAEIEIQLLLWTEEHLKTFAELVPLLKPREKTSKTVDRYKLAGAGTPGVRGTSQTHQGVTSFKALSDSLKAKQKVTVTEGGPQPVSIYHPALALFKIRSVVILNCSLPEMQHGSTAVYVVRLKCDEFISGAARNGSVSTKKKSLDLVSLGPGAVANKLKNPTPADDNTGP